MKVKVLVVDDDSNMREGMTMTLMRAGYDVVNAENGVEALKTLENDREIQLVVSDVRMPGMSGMELLEKLKKIKPYIPVIMVTAYGTIGNAVEAMKYGAFDYILKPFSFQDLEHLVNKAAKDLHYYGEEKSVSTFQMVTDNSQMKKVLDMARQAAKSDATVLIQAESGTGKELLSRFIHEESSRVNKPFVAVNCAALPENLLESELFGYEKGAFTGAANQKPGKFEMADNGTILLDEIGEMAPILQAKLLRVIQEREVDRVGGKKPIPIDVRVIAVTNKNLKEKVVEGKFREDLYFRLNVVPLKIPPLRDRIDDIDILVPHFIEKYGKDKKISQDTVTLLKKHDWPGNIRELENVIQRACVLCESELITPKDLFSTDLNTGRSYMESLENEGEMILKVGSTVEDMEKTLIELTLKEYQGNKTQAAKVLGISLRTLRNKINQYPELGRYKG